MPCKPAACNVMPSRASESAQVAELRVAQAHRDELDAHPLLAQLRVDLLKHVLCVRALQLGGRVLAVGENTEPEDAGLVATLLELPVDEAAADGEGASIDEVLREARLCEPPVPSRLPGG